MTTVEVLPETFDMWGRPTPAEPWGYSLDEVGDFCYGEGLWPFYERERPRSPKKRLRSYLRLAPDCDYRSWRNEYVLVGLDDDGVGASARLTLFVREQGMGAVVIDRVDVKFDLAASTFEVDARCPAEQREQAQSKARKILDLIERCRGERDKGKRKPVLAWQIKH